jgi:hypothetical protein
MFAERNRRRELKRKMERVREEQLALGPTTLANAYEPERQKLGNRFIRLSNELEMFESALLLDKAERLGIERPEKRDWWANDDIGGSSPDDVSWWLSQKGRIGVANLIKQERRKDFEWWLKVIAALVGLGGVLIGIILAFQR